MARVKRAMMTRKRRKKDQGGEGRRIVDRHLGEHLAVEGDAGLLQAVHNPKRKRGLRQATYADKTNMAAIKLLMPYN